MGAWLESGLEANAERSANTEIGRGDMQRGRGNWKYDMTSGTLMAGEAEGRDRLKRQLVEVPSRDHPIIVSVASYCPIKHPHP